MGGLRPLLARALRLEPTNPKGALRLFQRFERMSRARYVRLIPLAVASPVIVTLVVQFVGQLPGPWGHCAILAVLLAGYLPYYAAFSRREVRRGFRPASGGTQLFWLFGFLVAVLWGPLILLLYVVAVAAILGTVTLLPVRLLVGVPLTEWRPEIMIAIQITLLLLALAWVFADLWPPLPRWRYLPGEIAAGLRRSGDEFLQFIGGLAVATFAAGGGFLGLLYEHRWRALIAAGGSGLLMGLGCRSHAGRKPELLCIGLLGQARCLLRLGRRADCSRRLREIWNAAAFLRPIAVERLAEATTAAEGRWLEEGDNPQDVATSLLTETKNLPPPEYVPEDVWMRSLENTKDLIEGDPLVRSRAAP